MGVRAGPLRCEAQAFPRHTLQKLDDGFTLIARMAYRKERVSHFIRDVVSDAIANRISDPRVSRFTSVTRVEVSPDMKQARVFVSVMGEEKEGLTTMKGLESARGMIQSRLAKEINMRQCPTIRFQLDPGIKRAIDTFQKMSPLASADSDDAKANDEFDAEEMDDESDEDR